MFKVIRAEIAQRKSYLRKAAAENAENNLKTLRRICWITTALLIFFLAMTPFILNGWRPSRQHILFLPVILLYSIGISLYNKKGTRSPNKVTALCVLYEMILLTFIVLIDAESDRSAASSFICMLVVCLPILFVFPFSLTYGVIGGFSVLYILAVHLWKDSVALQQHETFNVICALFFSITIEWLVFSLRMKEYDRRIKYEQLSFRDSMLQNVFNKRSGLKRMQQYLKKTSLVSAGFVVMDLDNFKQINDTFGHYKGDVVLQHTGEVLNEIFNTGDIIVRFGGDEFMILICDAVTEEELRAKCTQINESLTEMTRQKLQTPVSCSIGALIIHQQTIESFDALFCQADSALYDAKSKGKNCVVIHSYREGTDELENGRKPFNPTDR